MEKITAIYTKKQYTEAKKQFDALIKEATEKGLLKEINAENEYTAEIGRLGRLIGKYERNNVDFGVFNSPLQPQHPSEVIREELEERGLTQAEFSEMLEVSKTQLNEILNGKRQINANISVRLEVVLGIPAEFWLRLQTAYDIAKARTNEKNQIQRLNFSRRHRTKPKKRKQA